jgi:hypothetical protein
MRAQSQKLTTCAWGQILISNPQPHRIIVNNLTTKIGNGHAIMEEKEAKKCHSCGVEMQYMGEIPFRTGGTSGAWIFLFDKIAQASEDTLPLYVYVCPKCRRTELFMDEKTFRDQLQIQHALRRDE